MASVDRAEQLRRFGRSVLEGARSEQVRRLARQVNTATYTSAREYAGRSLLELLQNGYDAHPRGRCDGQVRVLLDEEEGEWGTLYVANGGAPFTWKNVEKVCELAQSSKPVGEGIGNKGVGFRSVLLISNAPEIYSADPDDPSGRELDGYCFRFAHRGDVEAFLGDEPNAHEVAAEFPPLQAPLPLDEVPAVCRELAAEGHVTVVRLPLLNEAARAEVRLRLRELAEAKAPVMLFLDRLARLTLERRPSVDQAAERWELTRAEEPFATAGTKTGKAPVSFATVYLGPSGTFLVARGSVEEERLNSAVDEAVGLGLLDETWQRWTAPAAVEIAVPLPVVRRPRRGQIYTFLPMGEDLTSPFPGHANAPFFTKIDRTGLPSEHPLNTLLFDAVAETCLAAAAMLRTMPQADMTQLAVDLVSWETSKGSAGLLRAAAQRVHDSDIADVPLVPVIAHDAGQEPAWASPQEAILWPDPELTVLTAHRAHAAGIVVADPAVGGERLHRLAATCKSLACPLEPARETLAGHVERIVATLARPTPRLAPSSSVVPRPRRVPRLDAVLDQWSELYEDLAVVFQEDGYVLRGRKLLLAEDGMLRHANHPAARGVPPRKVSGRGTRREAFFQPVRADMNVAEGPAVPALLGRRLFCLHPGLVWNDHSKRGRSLPARTFLESSGLVRPFDMRSLLDHVRQALIASTDHRLRVQALRFVFRLWQPRRSLGSTTVSSLGLYVPSMDGRLIKASGGVFGRGWGHDCAGEDLATVVAAGQHVSKSLKVIADHLIATPDDFVKRGDTADEWRAFLTESGVADGLEPTYVVPDAESWADGQELTTRQLVRLAKVSLPVREHWEPHIDRPWSRASYPRTYYHGSPAYQLPGQDVVEQLGQSARLAYARLVLHGLAHWEDMHFTSTWASAGSRSTDRQRVLTPLSAFVREQPWLPVRGRERAVSFVRPADAWHCPPGLEEEPSYAATVDQRVRRLVERDKARDRLREMKMPTWDDPRDSARALGALGLLASEGALGAEDRPAAQRANERAWKHLVQQPRPSLPGDTTLLVESGDQLIGMPLSALDDHKIVLYISDRRDGLTALLVREMACPLLVVPGVAAKAAQLLAHGRSERVRHADDVTFTVTVDGRQVEPVTMGEPLVDQLPWLALAVGVLADHLASGPRASEAELNELTSAVKSIRLHRYRSWNIELDGQPVTLPARLGGVLPLPDPKHPLLLAPESEPNWHEAARMVEATAELLKRREFGIRLRLATHVLAARHADLRDPGQDELAEALEVTVHQIEETSRRIDGAIGVVVERCRPFLIHLLGATTADALLVPPPADTRELQAGLEKHSTQLPLTASEFITQARAARSTDELRHALGVGFAELNDTLRSMTPPMEPISHAHEHQEALHAYLDLHRKDLLNRLRWAALNEFDARRPMPHWPSLSTLKWINTPEVWNCTVETADTERLETLVEQELTRELGRPAPRAGERLPALDQVRSTNLRTITTLAADIAVLVKAARRPLPPALTGAEPATEVTARLEAAGALDFRPLAAADVIAWLAVLGQWPARMPATTDLDRHGLTEADLDAVRKESEHARREQERQRRSLSVGGRAFDVHSSDFTALTRELQRVLASGAMPGVAAGPLRFTDPQTLTDARQASSTGRPRAGRYGSSADRALTTAQREAIGYLGEWYAYQWLCAHYPDSMDGTCWVSMNRRKAFPGPPGDDGLGFDFRIGSGRRPYMFEVKATQSDGGRFELGESEVRAAQQHAGNDRWRLLIVTHALTPARMNIHMLPNPYAKRGRGRYREEGGSLRFSYQL